jgi:hypothetical protein
VKITYNNIDRLDQADIEKIKRGTRRATSNSSGRNREDVVENCSMPNLMIQENDDSGLVLRERNLSARRLSDDELITGDFNSNPNAVISYVD